MNKTPTVTRVGDGVYRVEAGGRAEIVYVAGTAADGWAFSNGEVFRTRTTAEPAARSRQRSGRPAASEILAPMPATVLKVNVKPGDTVAKGDVLIVLEAMKMELPMRAPGDDHRDGCVLSRRRSRAGGRGARGVGARGRMTPTRVTIVEVGPRDGLQNEHVTVATADKIAFVDRLSAARPPGDRGVGVRQPEMGAADGATPARCSRASRRAAGIRYTALVPNLAGLDRALAAGVTEIAIFAASTETFSRKNINQSIDESLAGYRQVCDRAIAAGLRVRGYLSTAFGCPFEGEVAPERVADVAARLSELGVFEVAISDTIGIAHPGQVPRVLDAVLDAAACRSRRAALPRHARNGARERSDRVAVMASPPSTRQPVASVAARTRRAPQAIWPPTTCSTCWTDWGFETGVSLDAVSDASDVHRLEDRSPAAVALLPRYARNDEEVRRVKCEVRTSHF